MLLQLKAQCKRIRRNNGIVEALFSSPDTSNGQEYHVLVNVKWEADQFEQGKTYSIEIKNDET